MKTRTVDHASRQGGNLSPDPGGGAGISEDTPLPEVSSQPWKWDVTIFDKPGWSTPWMTPPRLIGDEIVMRCSPHAEDTYDNDFYTAEEEVWVTLSSVDGGRSWSRTVDQRYDQAALIEPSDGDLVLRPSFPQELDLRRREQLQQAGLGHLADKGKMGWTIFPEAMLQELKEMGYCVFAWHPYIPQGQIAVHSLSPFGKWSGDGGITWQPSQVECTTFAHGLVEYVNGKLWLPDGTMLVIGYGCPLFENTLMESNGNWIYVLRSTDQGRSWTTTRIESPTVELNESFPLVLSSGRILLLIRSGEGYIHQTWSDDNGQTWLPIKRSPIWGHPLGALCLKSGAVLCTYAHRRVPGGIRACLSRDEGETWDIENEKILRDDVIPNGWLSPTGVHSVQLADDSIFTAFTVQKASVLKEGDIASDNVFRVSPLDDTGQFHCYLAGCRYTEDYVRPLA